MQARAELAGHLDALALTAQAILSLTARLNPADLRELLEACPFPSLCDALLDLDSWAGAVVEALEAASPIVRQAGPSEEQTA
jgi:hypothetical protein